MTTPPLIRWLLMQLRVVERERCSYYHSKTRSMCERKLGIKPKARKCQRDCGHPGECDYE